MLASLPPDILRLLILNYCDIITLLGLTWTCRKLNLISRQAIINCRIIQIKQLGNDTVNLRQLTAPYPNLYLFLLPRIIFINNKTSRHDPSLHLLLIKHNKFNDIRSLFDDVFNYKQGNTAEFIVSLISLFFDKELWLEYFYQKKYFSVNKESFKVLLEHAITSNSLTTVKWLFDKYLPKVLDNEILLLAAAKSRYSIYFFLISFIHPLSKTSLFTDVITKQLGYHFVHDGPLFIVSHMAEQESEIIKYLPLILKHGLWDLTGYVKALAECVEYEYFMAADKIIDIVKDLLPFCSQNKRDHNPGTQGHESLSLASLITSKLNVLTQKNVAYVLHKFPNDTARIYHDINKKEGWSVQIVCWAPIAFINFLTKMGEYCILGTGVVEEMYNNVQGEAVKMGYLLEQFPYLVNNPVTVKSLTMLKWCKERNLPMSEYKVINPDLLLYLMENDEDKARTILMNLTKSNGNFRLNQLGSLFNIGKECNLAILKYVLTKYKGKSKFITPEMVIEVGRNYVKLRDRCKERGIDHVDFEKSIIANDYLRVIELMVRHYFN
jgi:hypothetical protein